MSENSISPNISQYSPKTAEQAGEAQVTGSRYLRSTQSLAQPSSLPEVGLPDIGRHHLGVGARRLFQALSELSQLIKQLVELIKGLAGLLEGANPKPTLPEAPSATPASTSTAGTATPSAPAAPATTTPASTPAQTASPCGTTSCTNDSGSAKAPADKPTTSSSGVQANDVKPVTVPEYGVPSNTLDIDEYMGVTFSAQKSVKEGEAYLAVVGWGFNAMNGASPRHDLHAFFNKTKQAVLDEQAGSGKIDFHKAGQEILKRAVSAKLITQVQADHTNGNAFATASKVAKDDKSIGQEAATVGTAIGKIKEQLTFFMHNPNENIYRSLETGKVYRP